VKAAFVERFAPNAFVSSIAHDRQRIRLLYAHGHDARVGDRPLGPLQTLREDEFGLYFES
jgi:phage head maturation protease